MKLFKVSIQKSHGKYAEQYVVSSDPTTAYKLVRKFMDENDLCFSKDRELDSVTLIADEYKYNEIEKLLHIDNGE